MTRKQKTICEKLGWDVLSDENDIILSQYSPAGEDFSFYAKKARFKDSVKDYAEDFNPDEHAIMWIENMHTVKDVPQSIRALINDADAIKSMLTELYEQINKI